jgi:hypothetical protein
MLAVRAEQLKVLKQASLRQFEDEMVEHSKTFSPRLCDVIGDDQLRVAIRQAMKQADSYGFTFRGPIRLYIELMFLFGSSLDTDPQYPAIGEALNSGDEQMGTAEQLYAIVLDYQEKVSGKDNINVFQALEALLAFSKRPVSFSEQTFEVDMRKEMTFAFPQKADYVGEQGLLTLIQKGHAVARKFGFPGMRGAAMIVVLMFAFGHGCIDDPLYPWISQTLQDEKIKDPAARAKRLEKKALTWLDHVLEALRKGAQV